MTQGELKAKLNELVRTYFAGATVRWGKTKGTAPNAPLVVLRMGTVMRKVHAVAHIADGVPFSSHPSKTTLQVDLFTAGAPRETEPGTIAANENTAANDLLAFANFLYSPHVDHWALQNDISILPGPVQDLTELVNDSSWSYRAMTELDIGFTERAGGYAGMNWEGGMAYWPCGAPKFDKETGRPLNPDGTPAPPQHDADGNPLPQNPPQFAQMPSGGGSAELAEAAAGWFDSVDGPRENKGA